MPSDSSTHTAASAHTAERPGTGYDPWPPLPYPQFAPTAHLLHMGAQMLGKLKLATPFEPHWANVALWVTSSGLSTGPVPAGPGSFSAGFDLLTHRCQVRTSWGRRAGFALAAGSVADLYAELRAALVATGVDVPVDPRPQQVDDPVPFHEDTTPLGYDMTLANAWWRILVGTNRALHRHRARFRGVTPPVGLMWGTLDLRDVRYQGPVLPPGAGGPAYVESGFWPGSPRYPAPVFYSYAHPRRPDRPPARIAIGGWDEGLGEYVLDYELVRESADPEATLLEFLDATYQAVAVRGQGWPADLVGTASPDLPGEPR